ncbi:hypothetical protein [Aquibacillus saliphilus]|uniref:hypothetical protein n=1 Tax=Aquibacillus saliphilus TaxID=1909422 RepID=UPI001CF08EE0|nr:hypothetical protein [Aquibacillus saliphilus]
MTDKNNSNKKQDNNDRNSYVGFGVAFGLLGGAVFSSIVGIFFEFPLIWAFGPGLGMLIGIVIGSIMDLNKNKE